MSNDKTFNNFVNALVNAEVDKLKAKYPRRRDSEKRKGEREGLLGCIGKTEQQMKDLIITAEIARNEAGHCMNPALVEMFQTYINAINFVLDSLKQAHLNEP